VTLEVRSPRLGALRRAVVGALCGGGAFVVLSIAAPAVWKEVSPLLCRVSPPDSPFPSGACMILTALASALWLGPFVLAGRLPGLGSLPIPWLQAGSVILCGMLAGGLFLALGERKGALLFLAISAGAIALCSAVALTMAFW
jgi:hypothetical protein